MSKKIILATVAAVGTAQGVYANELQRTTTARDNTSAVTTAETRQAGEI